MELFADKVVQFYFPLRDVAPDVVRFVAKSRQQLIDFHKDHGDLFQIEVVVDRETSAHIVKVKPLLTPVSFLFLKVNIFYAKYFYFALWV